CHKLVTTRRKREVDPPRFGLSPRWIIYCWKKSPDACLTWEGSPFQGREAISGKLVNLPFKRIKHIITEQDFQPTIDSCILIMVFGQLQVDDDPPMAFHQVFMLKSQNCAWACTNDVFRLGIHNIPV
uniref:Nuclear transport factor 2 n=1 Tax=Amphiprion ocellaris TaxID=80972 RepID=A0A3Q1B9L5_AMPOC